MTTPRRYFSPGRPRAEFCPFGHPITGEGMDRKCRVCDAAGRKIALLDPETRLGAKLGGRVMFKAALLCEQEGRYRGFTPTGEHRQVNIDLKSSPSGPTYTATVLQIIHACDRCGWERGYGNP